MSQDERDARLRALVEELIEINKQEKIKKEQEALKLAKERVFFSLSVTWAVGIFCFLIMVVVLSYVPVMQ